MNNPPIDPSFSSQSSPSLPSSSTPMPNRRLFVGPHDPPTTLSKSQYMVMALQHITQTNPNISGIEMADYVLQTDQANGAYLLNFPPAPYSPPPPPIPNGFGLSSSTPPSINVIVQQGSFTDNEREVAQLTPDATLQEFIHWQKRAKETLSLIDHFHNDILLRPRHEIIFAPLILDTQINMVYKTAWTKLQMAISKLTG